MKLVTVDGCCGHENPHTSTLNATCLYPGCGCRAWPPRYPVVPFSLPAFLELVEAIDAFLDSHRSPEYIDQPLANDWARVTKVCSEAGEVWDELSKLTGENFRKGVCGDEDALLGELGDRVSAAICGIQHRTKDRSLTWAVVSAAFRKAEQRMVDALAGES